MNLESKDRYPRVTTHSIYCIEVVGRRGWKTQYCRRQHQWARECLRMFRLYIPWRYLARGNQWICFNGCEQLPFPTRFFPLGIRSAQYAGVKKGVRHLRHVSSTVSCTSRLRVMFETAWPGLLSPPVCSLREFQWKTHPRA